MMHLGISLRSILVAIIFLVVLIVGVVPQEDFAENDYMLAVEEYRYQDAIDILKKKPSESLKKIMGSLLCVIGCKA